MIQLIFQLNFFHSIRFSSKPFLQFGILKFCTWFILFKLTCVSANLLVVIRNNAIFVKNFPFVYTILKLNGNSTGATLRSIFSTTALLSTTYSSGSKAPIYTRTFPPSEQCAQNIQQQICSWMQCWQRYDAEKHGINQWKKSVCWALPIHCMNLLFWLWISFSVAKNEWIFTFIWSEYRFIG